MLRRLSFFSLLLSLLILTMSAPVSAQGKETVKVVPAEAQDITLTFAPLVKRSAPAVVNIYASRKVVEYVSPFMTDPLFRRFFGDLVQGMPQRERYEKSLGSGVIVSEQGLVVTNHHVIEHADAVRVVLHDRREYDAEIVISDPRTDLAVLRIDPGQDKLTAVSMVDSDEVEVGDLVLAIGNPFGVGQTVTQGIVSALARTEIGVTDFNFFIQTDAAINPGNSGGALIDVRGNLIGINTAIFSRNGGSQGVGFAIPANMVRTVVQGAETGGEVLRPWFGASGQNVTRELAESLSLPRPAGVLVNNVYPHSPADEAGIKSGDVVIRVNGREVNDPAALRFRVATLEPDSDNTVTYLRDGKEISKSFVARLPPEDPPREEWVVKGRSPLQGALVANMSPALLSDLGRDGPFVGVVVLDVDPRVPAAHFGIRKGDFIIEINGRSIDSVSDLRKALKKAQKEAEWRLILDRNGQLLTLLIRA